MELSHIYLAVSDEILAKRTYAQTAIFHVLMWCGSCGVCAHGTITV